MCVLSCFSSRTVLSITGNSYVHSHHKVRTVPEDVGAQRAHATKDTSAKGIVYPVLDLHTSSDEI